MKNKKKISVFSIVSMTLGEKSLSFKNGIFIGVSFALAYIFFNKNPA